jgi:RNA polymerase sigma factor (sigma-70 family)
MSGQRSRPAPGDAGEGPSPEELAARALGGSAEAIGAFYQAEHPRVWRLCLGLLADPAEADDVAQDAMLHLIDHLERWDPARPWSAWRNTVVIRLGRDRLRRIEARRRAEQRAAEDREQSEHDREDAPGSGLERAEASRELARALAALSPREREAFVLCDLEERPTREAAEVLGIGESSVRSLLALARRRLRGLLAPTLGSAEPGASPRG